MELDEGERKNTLALEYKRKEGGIWYSNPYVAENNLICISETSAMDKIRMRIPAKTIKTFFQFDLNI